MTLSQQAVLWENRPEFTAEKIIIMMMIIIIRLPVNKTPQARKNPVWINKEFNHTQLSS